MWIVSVAALGLLSACGAEQGSYEMSYAEQGKIAAAPPAPMMASDDYARSTGMAAGGGEMAEQPSGGVLLAYSYQMGVEAPKDAIRPLAAAHERACVEAGPALCQVLSSSVYGDDDLSVWGALSLRAEPKWLETFRGAIASDAEKSGGRIASQTVSAEDLTASILDVDARLQAKTALRDRIRQLLEEHEGELGDLLQAERELANVQGEIDSMTSQLNAMRQRVAMSDLRIDYSSDPVTSQNMFRPLGEALTAFGRNSMYSLAAMVNFVAGAWPFFILLLIVGWIVRRWWRGRSKK